jgi:pyruvate,water dikinase
VLLRLSEPACTEVAQTGGKGASLARMAALGLPVPPGFVVCASTLAAALARGAAGDELRAALARVNGDADLADAAERAQAIVHALPLDGPLGGDLATAYAELGPGDVPVAVRSSARSEDSEVASFAGQQETFLHVRGADEVALRVRDCWGSYFSERALFYRRRKGSLEDLDMAVVVQRMVEPDASGVLFTVDPVRGRRDQMVVESVFGLGEAVVSGEVTPDHFVVARDGRVKRQRITVQPYAIVRSEQGGTARRELSAEHGASPSLGESELGRLAALGRDLEERFGGPQDIEWAMQGGELFVLQCRPVTT